jgi:transposase
MEPGANASEVARAAGIHSSQLFRWRQELCLPTPPAFSPVAVLPEPASSSSATSPPTGVIEIELPTGGRMRITGVVEATTVSALVNALTKSKRRR